jgi:hypothetical protein
VKTSDPLYKTGFRLPLHDLSTQQSVFFLAKSSSVVNAGIKRSTSRMLLPYQHRGLHKHVTSQVQQAFIMPWKLALDSFHAFQWKYT